MIPTARTIAGLCSTLVLAACVATPEPEPAVLATTAGELTQCKGLGHGQAGRKGHGCGQGQAVHACKPWTPAASPVDAALPGEPLACQAMGIVACDLAFAGWAGEDVYTCVDAAGQVVAKVPQSDAATLPCSQAQLDAWVKAYDVPCWKWVAFSTLPPSAIPLVLEASQTPAQVCSNVDGTSFLYYSACARHTYTIDKTTGGGNFSGTYWTLRVKPPTTAGLKTGLPFLGCGEYSASAYCAWHVTVQKTATELRLQTDDIAPPCKEPVAWAEVLTLLTSAFTTCGATYAW